MPCLSAVVERHSSSIVKFFDSLILIHRFTQMNNLSLIITDFLFWHGNPRLFLKDTAWLRMDITTALRDYGLLAQVHGLVFCTQAYAQPSRVYTLYSLKAN